MFENISRVNRNGKKYYGAAALVGQMFNAPEGTEITKERMQSEREEALKFLKSLSYATDYLLNPEHS